MKAIIKTSGAVLAGDVETAESLFARLKGLLGRSGLSFGHALWIRPCNGIHTFGMRFPIDVVVLDRDLNVRAIHPAVNPWRMTTLYPVGCSVLELPAGATNEAGLCMGDTVMFAP